MSGAAIIVDQVWKKFERGERHDSLRDLIPAMMGRLLGTERTPATDLGRQEFWALEMGAFIDTPVKRYSSGMQARLGFAIAAHLDAEVLIVDEVLSVGDVAFQERALERMRTLMRRQDVPVIVVSHQLEQVAAICSQAVLLDHGCVVAAGRPSECIGAYLRGHTASERHTGSVVTIDAVTAANTHCVRSGERLELTVTGSARGRTDDLEPVCLVVRSHATADVVFASSNTRLGIDLPPGPFRLDVSLQMNVLPGLYGIETSTWDRPRGQTVGAGPTMLVQVEEGPNFWGTAQLSPRMRLRSDSGRDGHPLAEATTASMTAQALVAEPAGPRAGL